MVFYVETNFDFCENALSEYQQVVPQIEQYRHHVEQVHQIKELYHIASASENERIRKRNWHCSGENIIVYFQAVKEQEQFRNISST
jgi:hypothetical protein